MAYSILLLTMFLKGTSVRTLIVSGDGKTP